MDLTAAVTLFGTFLMIRRFHALTITKPISKTRQTAPYNGLIHGSLSSPKLGRVQGRNSEIQDQDRQWSNVGVLARSGDCRWCAVRPRGCAVHSCSNRLYNCSDYSRFILYILPSVCRIIPFVILRPTANSTLFDQRHQYYPSR